VNILIFNPDVEKLRIISFALESRLGIHVMQADRVEKAFEYLLEDAAVDLLVMSDTASTPLFVKYLASLGSRIPVILVKTEGQKSEYGFPGINISAQLNTETLLQDLPALIGSNFRFPNSGNGLEMGFCRIGVELLKRIGSLKGDVYVKLSNLKFVKLFNADTVFTDRDLERIWGKKGIDYLYIRKEDSHQFVQKLQTELAAMMKKANEGDDSLLTTVAQVQDTIQGLIMRAGVTDEVIKLTNTHVDFALKVIGRTPQLRKVMSTILGSKEGYIANHSVQVAHIACCIAAKLEWPSNTTYQKLIFAAFIHDLALMNTDHARVTTKVEMLKFKGVASPEDYTILETHMTLAADIANRFSQVPSDVCQIILQHHELPDGKGFPRGLTAAVIAPLAAVFVAAHELTDEIQKTGQSFNLEMYWQQKQFVYTAGTFKTIAKAFVSNSSTDAA
jgi:HD-GYP domain-containing protein (c-di-GMP phosphodiesterase class II)